MVKVVCLSILTNINSYCKCAILTNISPTCLTIYDFMKSLQQFSDHNMWNSKHEYFNGNVISLSCSVYRPGLVVISWTRTRYSGFVRLKSSLILWIFANDKLSLVSVLDSNVFDRKTESKQKFFSRLNKILWQRRILVVVRAPPNLTVFFLILSFWHLPHYFKNFCKFSKD